ncbi:MAG: alpha/beta hydrolase, partial [Verrucomicrobia bacterium]|nr:alpha/beta hydrolase [Verrucomicrobiota bacterium]
MIKCVFVVMLLGLGFAKLPAAELKIWKLLDVWPGKVPGEKGDVPSETLTTHKYRGAPILKYNNVTKPTLTVFKPSQEQDTGASVVICPGG